MSKLAILPILLKKISNIGKISAHGKSGCNKRPSLFDLASVDVRPVLPGPKMHAPFFLIMSCAIAAMCSLSPIQADNTFIVEGKSMGDVHLGATDAQISAVLGKTDRGDAAMGQLTLSWFYRSTARKDDGNWLDIYFRRDEEGRNYFAKEIHTNLSRFKTREGISVLSSLTAIRRAYPDLRPAMADRQDEGATSLYDSAEKGIAFEFDAKEKCIGIILHKPGVEVVQMYPFGSIQAGTDK
jgi:hypothetical protein